MRLLEDIQLVGEPLAFLGPPTRRTLRLVVDDLDAGTRTGSVHLARIQELHVCQLDNVQ